MILHIAAHICPKGCHASWWFRANHLALLGTRRLSQTVNSHDRSAKVCTESLVHAARTCVLGSHVERVSQYTNY